MQAAPLVNPRELLFTRQYFFVMDISFGRAERPQLYLPVGKHVLARSFPHPCLSSDQSQPTLQRSQSGGPQPDGGY